MQRPPVIIHPLQSIDFAALFESLEAGNTGRVLEYVDHAKGERFEVVAGARRFRAAKIAEQFSLPARIVELSDAAAIEWRSVAEIEGRLNEADVGEPKPEVAARFLQRRIG